MELSTIFKLFSCCRTRFFTKNLEISNIVCNQQRNKKTKFSSQKIRSFESFVFYNLILDTHSKKKIKFLQIETNNVLYLG